MTLDGRYVASDKASKRTEHLDFGVVDRYGRAIGATIITGIAACQTEAPPREDRVCFVWGPKRPDGAPFYYSSFITTRDGVPFGQYWNGRHRFYDTEAERDAELAAYCAKHAARTRKKHAA